MPHSVKAQLVMDVICAHSYLGYTRFVRAADRRLRHSCPAGR